MKLTGERVTTPKGGFNPTWQRHVAAYALSAPLLHGELVLDLGCGVGHSYRRLGDGRETIGLDLDAGALSNQQRPVMRADMRRIPLRDAAVDSVLSVQSLEHVPDPERTVADVARVVDPTGTAVFVTPNRLTFGRPDEIIDPWHYIEFDADQLKALCDRNFGSVDVLGLFGSQRYLDFQHGELRKLERMLRLDPLRLRRLLPRRAWQWGYSAALTRSRRQGAPLDPAAEQITPDDFRLDDTPLAECLDLVAVCREPRQPTT